MNLDTKEFNAAENEKAAEEMLERFDKESTFRKLKGKWGIVISLICILFSLCRTEPNFAGFACSFQSGASSRRCAASLPP